jgi:hypothetical protein
MRFDEMIKLYEKKESMPTFIMNNECDIDSLMGEFSLTERELADELLLLAKAFFQGGRYIASGMPSFDDAVLDIGTKHESEHVDTTNKYAASYAERIALDHLTEDVEYYDKLEGMESGENQNDDVDWQSEKNFNKNENQTKIEVN